MSVLFSRLTNIIYFDLAYQVEFYPAIRDIAKWWVLGRRLQLPACNCWRPCFSVFRLCRSPYYFPPIQYSV